MRKAIDVYLAAYLVGSLAIVIGFTAADAVPPRWFLAGFMPFLLLALGGVVWLVRESSLSDKVSTDRSVELGD